MKRMIVFMLVALMFMMSTVSAVIYPPMPINGKVDGINVGGLEIEITNLRTGKTAATETTGAGEYLVDWSNTDDESGTIIKFMIGDEYMIIIPSCSHSIDCIKTVTYLGESEIYSYFDLTSITLPCPIHEPCLRCNCPVCPEPTWENIGVGLVVGLMIGLILFVGGGMKFYKNRAGDATLQHRHKGIKEYHDPNTLHNNIAYRHTRWKDNPMKCIMDVKKIEELGGMV